MKTSKALLIFISIFTGLLYVLRLYGPMEIEAIIWGKTMIVVAMLYGLAEILSQRRILKIVWWLTSLLLIIIIGLQMPPMVLWFALSGGPISDGQGALIANPFFALPHVGIIGLTIWVLFSRRSSYTMKMI